MKEFQALGLDMNIIDDEGRSLDMKEIEEEESKDDVKTDIEEIEKPIPLEVSGSEEEYDDEEDSFDDDDDDDDFEEEFMDNENFEFDSMEGDDE